MEKAPDSKWVFASFTFVKIKKTTATINLASIKIDALKIKGLYLLIQMFMTPILLICITIMLRASWISPSQHIMRVITGINASFKRLNKYGGSKLEAAEKPIILRRESCWIWHNVRQLQQADNIAPLILWGPHCSCAIHVAVVQLIVQPKVTWLMVAQSTSQLHN